MKLSLKITLIWSAVLTLAVGALVFFDHAPENTIGLMQQAMFAFLAIIAFYIARKENVAKNKPIFINFAVLFVANALIFLSYFFGYAFFSDENSLASTNFYQYFTLGFGFFALAFAIVYVVFDTLFREYGSLQKYLMTFLVVGGFFAYYYQDILADPMYIFRTPDVSDCMTVYNKVDEMSSSGITNPTVDQVAAELSLPAWKDGREVGTLFAEENIQRIREILPFTRGENTWTLLAFRPLYKNVIYMSVLCVVFIMVFFGYQYKKDPPQGAYIEKIIFLLLPYLSFEILHNFAFIKSVDLESFSQLRTIGHYLTCLNIFLLVVFFSLRLSFISSIKGEFYERELVSDPEHISRWRDSIDNLVVRHFLNPQTIHGRLFAPRETKPGA